MSTDTIFQLILSFTYLVIISLLFVIRSYQKKLAKTKDERILISKTLNSLNLNSLNVNDLEELNKNYQILIKMLDGIKEDKENKEKETKCDEEIS